MPNEKGVLKTQLQPPKDRRTVITFKHNKKLKMMHVGHTYGPKVLLFDHSNTVLEAGQKHST